MNNVDGDIDVDSDVDVYTGTSNIEERATRDRCPPKWLVDFDVTYLLLTLCLLCCIHTLPVAV